MEQKVVLEEVDVPRDCVVQFQDPEELKSQVDNCTPTVNVFHDEDDSISSSHEYENKPNMSDTVDKYTPQEAIAKLKMDPNNVLIAKCGDKYYMDHKDLDCYMDACGETQYENALNNIIRAHEDTNLNTYNLRVVLNRSEYNTMSESTRDRISNSSVNFDIYG